jgi:hypothetical protein
MITGFESVLSMESVYGWILCVTDQRQDSLLSWQGLDIPYPAPNCHV